jgi:hypothetical protein
MKTIAFIAALFGFLGPASAAPPEPTAKPDVRIAVKAVSEGTEHNKKTRTSSRRLKIHLENREHRELTNLQLEWKIIGEDLNAKQKKVAESGKETIKLDADGSLDIDSGVAQFSETEGGTKTVGKGKNRRVIPQPDTGRNYAGYIVELKQHGKVIAEASTIGIRKQLGR